MAGYLLLAVSVGNLASEENLWPLVEGARLKVSYKSQFKKLNYKIVVKLGNSLDTCS